ncbi:MAG: hypothetical protein FJZ47_01660 [Candidatus Tectomicrobia bacterium]|uniref:Periplasmic chaperone PpiD n=1 Tax=Tectimicrobiota bacterium TaxID=2528274 RepID=A0A937VWS6_UNCTE|nr:hypothetical protein [Candidatus Tectomicrobia bacterium]
MLLQWMRDAQTWIIKGVLWAVVFAFVVTIFYQWGVQSSSGPSRSEVATIFGQPVHIREFQRVYNGLQQRYRAIFRTMSDNELNERFNFREMALEQLATRAILLRLAQQYGVTVTDQEVYDTITGITVFQDNGRFSQARYQAVLQSQVPPIPQRQFEAEQYQDLLLQKVSAMLTDGMHVTDAEVEQTYRREHEKVAVRYATLMPALFEAQVQVTDEDMQNHYEAQKDRYRVPEQRQIHYVAVPLQRFTSQYEPTAAEVSDYYAQHQETFQRQEQVRARHILIKVAASASAEQDAAARARAEAALTAVRNGEDFATVAQQSSEDTATASAGGDLGYFPRGQMVKPFEEAAFALPVGQLSDLVRSEFGWHILRVEDKREAELSPLSAVEAEIKDKLRDGKKREAALVFTDDLHAALEANPRQFSELARQHDLALVTTPFFPATGRVEGLEGVPDLVKRAYALPELGSDTLQGPDDIHYVFQTAAIQSSQVQPFAEARERVAQDLRSQKSLDLAKQQAQDWVIKLREGAVFDELASTLAVPLAETGPFKQRDPIPQLGRLTDFSRVLAGLKTGEVGAAQDGVRQFVLQVTERQPADMQAYTADKADYRQKLLDQKRQQANAGFQQFLRTQYQTMRQQGEIVVNPQYVF